MTIEELELENLRQFQERELKEAKDTIEKLMKEKIELIKALEGCSLPHFVLTKPQYRLFVKENN